MNAEELLSWQALCSGILEATDKLLERRVRGAEVPRGWNTEG